LTSTVNMLKAAGVEVEPTADQKLGGAGKLSTWTELSSTFRIPETLCPQANRQSRMLKETRSKCLVLLYPLRPQASLQWWQDLTREVVIESRRLVALKPACASAASHVRSIDPQLVLDGTGDQLSQLR
jgi:hypothetical protein